MDYDYAVIGLKRTVDGDTYDLTLEKRVDYGFYLIDIKQWTTRFRILGIDVWETNQAGGARATADAHDWIAWALLAGVLRGKSQKTDHFGRWLIDLYRTDTGEHLVDYLRTRGDEKA